MASLLHPLILQSLAMAQSSRFEELAWEPFRPGVEIHRLYQEPAPGPAAALLRYAAGAAVPWHEHGGYEHVVVLSGSQVDAQGEHCAGTLVINPPGSRHCVSSPAGCVVLIIWEKPVMLLD